MSKAIQCDKCHRCFSMEQLMPDEYSVRISSVIDQTRNDFNNQTYSVRLTDLDLCPECSRDFYIFMKIVRERKIANETTP